MRGVAGEDVVVKILESKCWIRGGGGGKGSGDGLYQCQFIKCWVKILRLVCRGHGEIPEPNYIGIGRFIDSWAHI